MFVTDSRQPFFLSQHLLETGNCSSSYKHARPGCQQHRAQDTSQPGNGHSRTQVRTEQSARDGTDQERANQVNVNIVHPKMEKTGDARKYQGMHDIGADHDFWLKAEEEQKHHHDDASGADGSDAHEEAGYQPYERYPGERSHSGRPCCRTVFDLFLEEQKGGNTYQQNTDGNGDEMIHAIAVNIAQMD